MSAPALALTDDDRALVDRDQELAGLPLVLSDQALSQRLEVAARVVRVRYKPGRSVVASWSAVDGSRHGWVGAYRDTEKVGKALVAAERAGCWSSVLDEERRVVATDVLGDRALNRPLTALGRRCPDLLDGARLLRHNPSRRQVWHQGDVVVRVGTEPVEDRHGVVAQLLAHGVPVVTPRPVPGVATVELLPWWGQGDLGDLPTGRSAHLAGRAVAGLHAVPTGRPEQQQARRPDTALGVLTVLPAARSRVLELQEQISRVAQGTATAGTVRLHGDLSPDQVLVDGDEVALIDLDRTTVGPRERDLGSFLAAAHLLGRHDLVVPFLEGYADGGGTHDPEALAAWQAHSLLQRSVEPFRRREDDWASLSAQVLTAAQQVLGR